ncbi:MAG TPA: hypothetical protein VNA69_14860 [Thermoanaerobaculia bacterium]|nr:hypothetical protein [Thermoanaerobaculia bacterium]
MSRSKLISSSPAEKSSSEIVDSDEKDGGGGADGSNVSPRARNSLFTLAINPLSPRSSPS